MIEIIKEDLLKYLSDKYVDNEWKTQTGQGFFNKNNKYPLSNFSMGNLRKVEKDFLLIQCKSVSGNRNDGMSGIGNIDYGTTVTLNIYIEKDVKPSDCAEISDIYMERLYELLQLWLYDLTVVTPVNPSISIDKYYQGTDNNFNSINKLVIDGSVSLTYKTNKLTLERINNGG